MPNPLIVPPRDDEESESKAADTRFQNAKQDFINLLENVGPLYDGLNQTQRNNQIAKFASPQTIQAMTDEEFRVAISFVATLALIGIDYLRQTK